MAHDHQVVFGRLLRAHRLGAFLTQEQLAERAGVSSRTIRDLERGRVRQPRADSVYLLADGLALAGAVREEFLAAARGAGWAPLVMAVADGATGVVAQHADGGSAPDDVHAPRSSANGPAAPFLLPPDIADFTGRADVVRRLGALLAGAPEGAAWSTAVMVAAVVGGGGVGKTTVAVHVAHRLRARFPDGQLFVDLRGAEASPADPEEVLGRLLRALGVYGAAIPQGADERAELYRGLLADRQVLVVLDNAVSEAQVIPLLPGSPTCAVLITSRARLAGLEGARLLDLDLLEAAQAVELLERIVGAQRVAAEPAAAAALARLCGYLPLALRVAGARLAARPHWQLAQLVERLADQRQRLDELAYGDLAVRASLTLSYQALEPATQALLRRLGLLEAPDVAAWVANALLDCPVGQASELVDRLVDARLLEVAGRDATGQVRYRLHDLVRVYARERVEAEDPPPQRRAALARAVGAWLHLAERADARLGSPLLEPAYGQAPRWPVDQATAERLLADPLAFLEAERAGLVAAVSQAACLGMAGLSWELTSALTQFLATRLHLDDWRRCAGQALAAARGAQDARGEAAVLLSLGILHSIYGRHHQALDCWQAALGIFTRLGDATGQAMCLAALAVNRSNHATHEQRRQQAEDALAILDQGGGGRPRARACVLYFQGLLHHNHGRLELAERCFEEALGLHRGLGSGRGEARLLYQLGAVRINQGRDDEAASMLRQALVIFRRHGDRVNGTPAEVYLGTALVHLGRYGQARPLLEPWMHSGFPFVRALALRGLGELYSAQGCHDDARAALREALRMFGDLDMRAEEAVTLRTLLALGEDGNRTHGDAHSSKARASPPPTA